MAKTHRPIFTDFEVLDCGDVEALRYVVEAIEHDPDDTGRAASVHIASCYSRETAELIKTAMEAQHQAKTPATWRMIGAGLPHIAETFANVGICPEGHNIVRVQQKGTNGSIAFVCVACDCEYQKA